MNPEQMALHWMKLAVLLQRTGDISFKLHAGSGQSNGRIGPTQSAYRLLIRQFFVLLLEQSDPCL
jgi:hypothetical protein